MSYSFPHFWKQSKDMIVGTLHVQVTEQASEQKVRAEVSKILKKQGVKNLTVEITKQ